MKVIIAAGGTGGHLYPGIAIARELLKERGAEVLFTGTEQGIEAKVLPKEGLPVRFITVGKLKGMKLLGVLKTLTTLPRSLYQSARLVREVRPDVVISVGGYSAGPVAAAAWAAGIPVLIVEPNSYAGLANRVAGRIADKVILCFPAADRQQLFSRKKTYMAGPLVRKGIERGSREHALKTFGLEAGRFTVFVMGGSGGAHAINMAMKRAASLLHDLPELQILHQTGERDVQDVVTGYQAAGARAHVLPYIHDMAGAYAAADLVVSRSGATTVAELAVCGKRAILIPFPFAADNHQEFNARSLEALGAAEVILQKDLSPELLAGVVRKYARSGTAGVHAMANTASEEIAGICRDYVQKD
ncbi:MAG: undecaprenyldiphospho-muramoylpentapeptide beta-N-acetylglucosaminyltransferase [Nitrospirae bacterium GWD2_57_9]|nr:MAG: undecaprenyldiphospho-muramoylpentapeptide beta-N-acetylglucosaminyltransferase [Nitrospirae bacterium GWD2_57_9]